MIYLFHGSDNGKVRRKAFEWVAIARRKESNLAYTRLSREEITEGALLEAASLQGLFAKRTLTLLDDPYAGRFVSHASEENEKIDETDVSSALDGCIDALATSENAIVILAPSLAESRLRKMSGKVKVAYEFNKTLEQKVTKKFNTALANALSVRNRDNLWLEVVRARRAGDAPEMVHGLLHWKARDFIEKGSRNWKPEEARKLSLDLINLLQHSRQKSLDLYESIERFALSI